METLRVDVDADGIALAMLDVPGRSMNTIGAQVIADFGELVDRVQADETIKGVVIASGKASGFCAGADLGELEQRLGPPAGGAGAERLRADYEATGVFSLLLRRLETCGKPVAAVIDGVALGGGLELALAAHFRVAVDGSRTKLGLPEATIGLLPGAGGTQRLPRIVGIMAALPLLIEGRPVPAEEAAKMGIVNALAADPEMALQAAKGWILQVGEAVQPWDRKGFKLPGGGVFTPAVHGAFSFANGALLAKTQGNYPALSNIMRCVFEGSQVPIDAALRIETRYFVRTLHTPQAQAMVRTLFLSAQELAKQARAAGEGAADPVPGYVERLRSAYDQAGLAMRKDGISPAAVANGARMAGFAKGPSVAKAAAGSPEAPLRDTGRDRAEELKRRLLYPVALEAARCLAERVIADPRVADVGAVQGFGFPAWTGGPLSVIDTVGAAAFVAECEAMSLEVPDALRGMAADGSGYYRDGLAALAA